MKVKLEESEGPNRGLENPRRTQTLKWTKWVKFTKMNKTGKKILERK